MTTSAVTRMLVAPIRFYQRFISPALPPTCRYYPTCSSYAVESLLVHGALRGSWLSIRRVGRCHPWHAGGFDPVPPGRERSGAAGSSPPVELSDERLQAASSPVSGQPSGRVPTTPPQFSLPDARPATAQAPTPRSSAA